MNRNSPLTLTLALALTLLACACSTTESTGLRDEDLPKPIVTQAEDSLGKFLADVDGVVARWSVLSMTAKSAAEQREARMLEQLLIERTSKRRDELVHELESGPPINRIRAAAALGFTHSVEAQSPLLNALHDSSADVVHNALLGLAILARADTPLEEICRLAEDSPDPQTRSQAAYAMRTIVGAGAEPQSAVPTARRGLISQEPLVRAECALTLGLAGDAPSVPALGDLLADSVPFVTQAAVKALVLLAKKEPSQKGAVGRALLACHANSKGALAERTMEGLVQISDVNYGTDVKLWTEWAQRLP